MSNTVDALKNLYKTLTGQDYAGDPNPTDAEMIDAIAKDASGGGSGGSSSGRVIELFAIMNAGQEGLDFGGQTDAGLTIKDLAGSHYLISMGAESTSAVVTPVAVKNNTSSVHEVTIKLNSTTYVLYYTVDTGVITSA